MRLCSIDVMKNWCVVAPTRRSRCRSLIGLFGAITDTAAIAFVGNGAARYREQILDLFGERAQIIGETCGGSAAGAVARLAMARLTEASGADLGQLVPLYLGASQALGNTRRILPNPLK